MVAVKMRVEGGKHLAEQLLNISLKVHDKAMKSAVRKVCRSVITKARRHLKRNDSIRTRALWKSLKVKVLKPKRELTTMLVGAEDKLQIIEGKRVNPGKYAHLVEFGHGGPQPAPPHPFLTPAVAETEGEALKIIEDAFRKHLAKYEH